MNVISYTYPLLQEVGKGRVIHFYFIVMCVILNINASKRKWKKVATSPLADSCPRE